MFWSANEPFAVSALIILLGYALKRTGFLEETAGESLAKVALNVTLPAVILTNLPSFPLLEGSNAAMPLYSLAGTAAMVAAGSLLLRRRDRADKGVAMMSLSGYNIGLFAVPLVMGLYGPDGVARFLLIDVGNAMAIFGLGYYLAALHSPLRGDDPFRPTQIARMLAGSIPFVSYLIAVVMNLAGWRLGGFLGRTLEVPAAMNRGVSLLAVGILLKFRFAEGTWKAIAPPLAIRYAVGAAGAAAALLALPVPIVDRIAVAGVLVMPAGLAVIPFSVKWGYDRERAAAILNLGIPVSFVLFWAVWAAGRLLQD